MPLASTANFLRKSGWRPGLPLGLRGQLPDGYPGARGRKARQPLRTGPRWASGASTDGRCRAGTRPACCCRPGRRGPAFLVTKNFDALYSYNAAESYASPSRVLSDRLRGAARHRTPWPTDDPRCRASSGSELQALLAQRGYDVGEPDGRIGQKTRDAIKVVEQQIGIHPTGRPGGKVLQALRGR